MNALFAASGIGWHYETGVQLLRLMLSGVFDRFPTLQLMVGHRGEVVLFHLGRAQQLATAGKLKRSLAGPLKAKLKGESEELKNN